MAVDLQKEIAWNFAMPVQKSTAPLGFKWDRLRIVLALARQGTLSAAARDLGVDHTTVARHLESLQRDLGGALFERGPEGFVMTPLGAEVVTSAERVEDELFGLLRRLDGDPGRIAGTLRLTAPPFLASGLFAPALGPFLRAHPHLRIELIGDNQSLDVARREADLAIRFARPELPALIARQLDEVAFACYAATTDPRPFEALPFLAYDAAAVHPALDRYIAAIMPSDRIAMRANTTQILLEGVRAGLGCALLPCLTGEADPALRRIPVPQAMPPLPLWLTYHEDMKRSPRLRAAVEFVETVIRASKASPVPHGFPAGVGG
ncbi:LysR family transcriptional regulator [Paracoccus sp. DMF-8]|uniref:LysR family transcriptional regulator n=1 Tax=Paracoccus sp. DMF-8 TaxID=3019445 RepID=UPI0023E8F378|nr:LysR family transcriptional regulator [Paracoccus sp. DMF-8]MDF3605381.1 LysR family transcriptional regulator [Paracoccus sp. DMF-8]